MEDRTADDLQHEFVVATQEVAAVWGVEHVTDADDRQFVVEICDPQRGALEGERKFRSELNIDGVPLKGGIDDRRRRWRRIRRTAADAAREHDAKQDGQQ